MAENQRTTGTKGGEGPKGSTNGFIPPHGGKLTNYLLDQQLKRLEQDFLNEGGLRERMTRARIAYRNPPPQE